MTTPTTVKVQLKLRQDTSSGWSAVNPILLAGELGRESNTGKIKIGDGSTAWNSLAYQPFGALITNADISATAEIAVSKLADGAARQLLQTDTAGTGVEWTSNVDVPGTLDVTSTATFDSIAQHPLGTAGAPTITFTGDTNTGIYSPGADQVAISTNGTGRLFVDASGNVGVGVTPSATQAAYRSIELFGSNWMGGNGTAPASYYMTNAYYDGAYKYKLSGYAATLYNAESGTHRWSVAASGTAGASVTWSEAMRLDSSGRLGLGTSTVSSILHINAGAAADTNVRLQAGAAGNHAKHTYSDSANTVQWTSGYRSSTNTFGINVGDGFNSTGLTIDNQGRVAIGTTSPSDQLHIYTNQADNVIAKFENAHGTNGNLLQFVHGSGGANVAYLGHGGDTTGNLLILNAANTATTFSTNNTERARIDSSGRLLVGTSTSASTAQGTNIQQIFSSTNDRMLGVHMGINSANGPYITFSKSRNTSYGSYSIVNNGDVLGGMIFAGDDGTDYASTGAYIEAIVDGTPGANDLPTRLVFSVTRDGSASPTEALRIANTGAITSSSDQSASQLFVDNTNASYAATLVLADSSRAANTAFDLFAGYSSSLTDAEFRARGDGNTFCDGAFTGGGADYAEYFEWSDGNTNEDDRRGISVVLDGDKIRPAVADEDPIGVISGNPSVVGDSAWNKWSGKYLRDEYGTYILEDYEVTNDEGEAVVQQRRKLNPAYDPGVEYISREERPEWDCVGLMGKLRLRKSQPTGSRWIKMRDISDSVEEWLVR